MVNPEHLQILQQGVEAWNQWREQNNGVRPALRAAALTDQPRHHFHYIYGSVRRPYPSYINSTSNYADERKNETPTSQRRSPDM